MIVMVATSFSVPQQAQAISVVETGVVRIKSAVTAAATGITAASTGSLLAKETIGDGIAYAIARAAVQSLTQSLITWINSGFQGKPAFVQDLKQHLLGIADEAAGNFIYNDPSLNFLCSPFQLDVKAALATSYQESQNFASEAQCTLSEVTDNVEGFLNGSFNEGGWASWFEVTQNPVNTPGGAYLAAESEMYARIVDEQGKAVKELDWGNGFLSFKVCSDTDVANGTKQDCDITTPGAAIADQLNQALGAGQQQLITADEINEIIGALFAQLAQKALGGMNGLLGLGSANYTDTSLGNNASSSYLAELEEANRTQDIIDEEEPFADAIDIEVEFQDIQRQIAQKVTTLEARIASHNTANETCPVTLPNDLKDIKNNAIVNRQIAAASMTVLENLTTQFTEAESGEEQQAVLEQFQDLQADGQLHTVTDVALAEILLDYTLPERISAVDRSIQLAFQRCNDDD